MNEIALAETETGTIKVEAKVKWKKKYLKSRRTNKINGEILRWKRGEMIEKKKVITKEKETKKEGK